jgi:hypothetical protein
MAYARKVDRNHSEIRDTLRALGWHVEDCSRVGGGFPDLIALKGKRVEFCEVKDGAKVPSAQKLTEAQQKLHAAFYQAGVLVKTLRTIDDCRSL